MNTSREMASRRLSTMSTVEMTDDRKTRLYGSKMSYKHPNSNQLSRNVTRSIKKRERRCTCSRCLRLSNTKSCQFTQKITMINRKIGTERLQFASVESSLTDLRRARGAAESLQLVVKKSEERLDNNRAKTAEANADDTHKSDRSETTSKDGIVAVMPSEIYDSDGSEVSEDAKEKQD